MVSMIPAVAVADIHQGGEAKWSNPKGTVIRRHMRAGERIWGGEESVQTGKKGDVQAKVHLD